MVFMCSHIFIRQSFLRKALYAEGNGVDGSVRVPRTGLRPILLLYLTAPSTPLPSATGSVGMTGLNTRLGLPILLTPATWLRSD
jgi:hypothetical protein